ncbi:MAG: ATP-grasp domain-containing protein [Deltaproteobacteria bacterium]|nr:ATP-grasp domain-containing protein [Deltaproteobacteria bacterium]
MFSALVITYRFIQAVMFIHNIHQISTLLQSLPGTFVGVGMTAFSRILPASFLTSYHIVALHKTGDLPLLRKKAHVFCLEEETENPNLTPGQNSEGLLMHPRTRRFLDGISRPKYFFLYQDYPELRSAAEANGWILLANPPQLRQTVGKRKFFKKMAAALGLHQAPGGIYPIAVIHDKGYEAWRRSLGPAFVVQLPEIEQGGGRGTFFVRSREDYRQLQGRLAENRWRDTPLESISVHRFLDGIPASMVVCVTRHGTLVSALQRQLLDLPYGRGFAEDGVFCGHAWGVSPGSEAVRKSAFEQACRIGDFLGTLGYKGILGIDFIVQEQRGAACPIEINPRLTGALPMLSLRHLESGIVPLEAFHILEFLGLSYQIDRDALNRQYAEPVRGSHLLLFRSPIVEEKGIVPLRAGLYEYEPVNGGYRFLKETLEYPDIQSENQFILSDGPRLTADKTLHGQDSHSRLCRLLFSYPIMDMKGALSPQALLAAEWVGGKDMKGDAL